MISQTIIMIYDSYLDEVSKAASDEARSLSGLSRLLTGKPSKTEELLPAFDEKLQNEMNHLPEQNPDSSTVRELAEWMLEQAVAYRDKPRIKYSFMAVQRHLIPLVGFLNTEDAAFLAKKFETTVPRRDRFPVIEELIKKLKKQS